MNGERRAAAGALALAAALLAGAAAAFPNGVGRDDLICDLVAVSPPARALQAWGGARLEMDGAAESLKMERRERAEQALYGMDEYDDGATPEAYADALSRRIAGVSSEPAVEARQAAYDAARTSFAAADKGFGAAYPERRARAAALGYGGRELSARGVTSSKVYESLGLSLGKDFGVSNCRYSHEPTME